jgi:hypothetical protein
VTCRLIGDAEPFAQLSLSIFGFRKGRLLLLDLAAVNAPKTNDFNG